MSFAEEKENSLHGAAGNGDAHVHDRVFQLFNRYRFVMGDMFVRELLAVQVTA